MKESEKVKKAILSFNESVQKKDEAELVLRGVDAEIEKKREALVRQIGNVYGSLEKDGDFRNVFHRVGGQMYQFSIYMKSGEVRLAIQEVTGEFIE